MGFFKKLGAIAIVCIIFRVSYVLGADVALDEYVQKTVNNTGFAANAVIAQSPFLMANTGLEIQAEAEAEEASTDEAETATETSQTDEDIEEHEAEVLPEEEAQQTSAEGTAEQTTGDTTLSNIVEKTITGGTGYITSDGVALKNATTYDFSITDLINKDSVTSLQVGAESPQVLIIHTHGSEAYAPNGTYVESDSYRTQDKNYSVIRVGEELTTILQSMGISVIHDTEIYDYPSYIGSYGRSLSAADAYVQQYPDIQVIIDLHRDALIEDDGTVYKTVANINGETCAQVMLVIGTNASGLDHDNWRDNLSLALKLEASMNEKYPDLARPVSVREERFNQHLASGAMILEVGTNGNTLEEAIRSAGYFADCLQDVLLTQ